jgi:rubredoxin
MFPGQADESDTGSTNFWSGGCGRGVLRMAAAAPRSMLGSCGLDRGATKGPTMHRTGGRHEFRCHACGFGARRSSAPPRCPMCGGTLWLLVPALRVAPPAEPRRARVVAPA